MRYEFLIFSCILTVATAALAEPSADPDTYYHQGVAAEQAGDPEAARTAYREALRLNPRHADATFRLGQLKHRREAIARKGRQAALAAVMLLKVQFDEASLRESLDALAKMIETESENNIVPNFVVQDPDGNLADAKISLQLRNVPAGTVLEYILGQADARARYDEFAVVITP